MIWHNTSNLGFPRSFSIFSIVRSSQPVCSANAAYFLITTAGTDRNSICFEQHQKAVDVIEDRKIAPTFYPVIYGASDEDDWTSEAKQIFII